MSTPQLKVRVIPRWKTSALDPANEVSDSAPAVLDDGTNSGSLSVESVTTRSGTQPAANPANDWYEVKRILKTKRKNGKDFYLVEWADSTTNTWVERKDLTDYAVQAFYASRPTRRRRRRRNY